MSAEERVAKTAMSCSAPSCSKNCASTAVAEKNQRLALSRQPLAYCESPDRRKNALPRLPRSREARGPQPCHPSPHLAALLRHASARSRRRSTHHSDPVRPSQFGTNCHLPPSLQTSLERHTESSGLATTERRVIARRVDESAAPGGVRSQPQRGSCIHRTKSPVAPLEACQSAASHCAVSHRRTRRSCRSMHALRASRHYFVQQLPQSPLPQVSDGCPGPLDRRAPKGASPDALRPRGLYTSRIVGTLGAPEQKAHR